MISRKSENPPQSETALYYGYVIVGAAFLIMVVIWGVFYSFGVFFKPMLNELGWTRAVTSGAFSVSAIISGLLGIAMGGLNDRFGPRIVLSFSGLLMGLGYVLMSQVSTVWQFYLFYGFILGAGMGGSFVPQTTTVARWFARQRGFMTGIITAGIGIGALVGPPVANQLISAYGWRVSYVILGSVLLAVVVLSAQLFKRDPGQLGQVNAVEKHAAHTALNPRAGELSLEEAAHTGQFWLVLTMIFGFGFSVFSIMVHIAPHASELGISPAKAANILATIGGVSIAGKILLGRMVDVFGTRRIFIVGFILMSGALLSLVWTKLPSMLFLFAAVFGFAYGGCVVSESPLVAVLFGLRSHGLILGVVAFSFAVGGSIGPWFTGYLFDIYGSYRVAFLICSAFSLVSFILATLAPSRASHLE